MVATEGVPPEPRKTSLRVVGRDDNDPAGGTKVRTANNALIKVITVGGTERRKMRIAMVSPSGHNRRIVKARWVTPLSEAAGVLALFTSILR
jgi:hypothetical protein